MKGNFFKVLGLLLTLVKKFGATWCNLIAQLKVLETILHPLSFQTTVLKPNSNESKGIAMTLQVQKLYY